MAYNTSNSGIVPYQGTSSTVQSENYASLQAADIARIQRCRQHWRFYHTDQWENAGGATEPLVTYDYSSVIVNKSVSWLLSNGVDFKYNKANAHAVKPIIEEVWRYNNRDTLLQDMAITGAVTGDIYVLVTMGEPTEISRKRNPYTQGQIRLDLLGSDQVFPTWDPLNKDTLLAVRIETVFYDQNAQIHQLNQAGHPVSGDTVGTTAPRRFTQIITRDTITEYLDGGVPVTKVNILGEVPVVHIKNLPAPGDFFGKSDLDPVLPIQQETNEKATDLSDIIHYHASPTTVITGAKAHAVEKKSNTLWSGLPADAKVYNLEMRGDLANVQEAILLNRRVMLEIGEIPEVLIEQPNISNTSGAALELMYKPIVDKTNRRKPAFQQGLSEINYFILRISQLSGWVNMLFDLCSNCGGRIVEMVDPLSGRLVQKCFSVDKDFTWTPPDRVMVQHIRQHSMGYEVREDPYDQVQQEHGVVGASYWDPEPEQSQQQYEQRQQPSPLPLAPGMTQPTLPNKKPVPPQLQGELRLPQEPEQVMLSTMLLDPVTGDVIGQTEPRAFTLVPTGCKEPLRLDPYLVQAVVKDSLPKDDKSDQDENLKLQNNKVVSAAWVRRNTRRIREEEYARIEEEIRDEERSLARPEGIVDEDKIEARIREQALGKAKPGVGPEKSELASVAGPGGTQQIARRLERTL